MVERMSQISQKPRRGGIMVERMSQLSQKPRRGVIMSGFPKIYLQSIPGIF